MGQKITNQRSHQDSLERRLAASNDVADTQVKHPLARTAAPEAFRYAEIQQPNPGPKEGDPPIIGCAALCWVPSHCDLKRYQEKRKSDINHEVQAIGANAESN